MPFTKGHPAHPKAGRPAKRDKHAGAIARAEKRIADRLPDLIDWQLELAEGVTVQEPQSDGTTKVYTRPPDQKAGAYLIDRIMGKPTARVEADVKSDDLDLASSTLHAATRELSTWREQMTAQLAASNMPSVPPTPRTSHIPTE